MANKKKVTNFNALRPCIIKAHRAGNRKAIDKNMVSGEGIDNEYFVMWQADCDKLRLTVADYVLKKRAVKYGYQIAETDVTADDVAAAREAIFPKWKEILQVGEASKDAKELKVDVDDVEDLIGFVWDFMDSGKGTVETIVSQNAFRKKVEALLGCAIAKNAVLEDGDRDTLSAYRHAEKTISNCEERKTELDKEKKSLETLKASLPAEEKNFAKFLTGKIAEIEDELKTNAEKKANADDSKRKAEKDAKKILQRIRFAK